MNSHDFSAFERLINMRRYGSRLNKVIAKRAIGMQVSPCASLRWAKSAIRNRENQPVKGTK